MITTYTLSAGHALIASTHATMREAASALPQGAYTTFRTYDGDRVLRFDQHLSRLEESIALMSRPASIDRAAARACVREAITQSAYPESRIRLTFAHDALGTPVLYTTIEPFTPYPPGLYESGVICITVPLRRENPHAKSTAFSAQAAAAYQQLPAGVHEGLMIADNGAVLEGLSSNFFAIMPPPVGQPLPLLHSEEARVLIGVTRSLVIECASGKAQYVGTALQQSSIPTLMECFITSVSREVMPVVQIDAQVIGRGVPGPVTRELMRDFALLIKREATLL